MPKKVDESASVYGAGVLLKHLAAFEAEIEGVRAAQDIEYIHRMRVASRRLRAALTLFWDTLPARKRESWQTQFRRITRALGAARDTDVQIEALEAVEGQLPSPRLRPGIERLLLRHRQRRAHLQTDVLQTLDGLAASGVLADIRLKLEPLAARQEQAYLYSPALYQLGCDTLMAQLDAFLAYEPFIHQPERIEELHAMRIAAKHLRYTLEALQPLYSDGAKEVLNSLKKAQEALGEIHDSDVWVLYLPIFIEKERQRTLKYYGHTRVMVGLLRGLNYFQVERQAHRAKEYQDFLALWQQIQEQQTWPKLRQAVQSPYDTHQPLPAASDRPGGETPPPAA